LIPHRFIRPMAIEPSFVARLLDADGRPEAALVRASPARDDVPYQRIGNIAVIPIRGVLVHSETIPGLGWLFGETTYSEIEGSLFSAFADDDVRAIVLHIASPGGDVDGCFELADAIYQARGAKPMAAIADPYAYSAAYALASAADMISVPATGGAGSVGVLAVHVEVSKALKEAGLGVTVIQYGEQKSERGPFEPLTKGARERMQDDVDMLGAMFVDLVARNRGMSTAAVRATKAGMLMGAAAVEAGLADTVMAPQAAFQQLSLDLERISQ
jgi:capsid assembly protease